MDINTCIYNEDEELSLPEFHKKYRDQFPITAIVVGGHYGQTKWDDLPSDLVMRVDREFAQPRVLARDPVYYRERYISIPVNGNFLFNIVKSIKEKSRDYTMAEILKEHPLPILVQFSARGELPREAKSADGLTSFLIEYHHEEIYLQGNFYLHGLIAKDSASVTLCPHISMAPVHGIKGKTDEEYQQYLARMTTFVKNKTTFSEDSCNPGVKVLEATDPLITHIFHKEDDVDRGPAPIIPQRSKPSPAATKPESGKPRGANKGLIPRLLDRKSPPKQPNNVKGAGKVDKLPPVPKPSPTQEKPTEDDDDDEIYYGGDYEEIVEEKKSKPVLDQKPVGYVNDILCQVKPFSEAKPGNESDESDEYEAIEEKPIPSFPEQNKTGTNGNVESKKNSSPTPEDVYSVPIEPSKIRNFENFENHKKDTSVDFDDEYSILDENVTQKTDIKGDVAAIPETVSKQNFVAGKNIQELGEILVKLRLEKHVQRFAEDLIDGEIITDLTVDDLKEDYKFTKTEAIRLRKYIEQGHIPS